MPILALPPGSPAARAALAACEKALRDARVTAMVGQLEEEINQRSWDSGRARGIARILQTNLKGMLKYIETTLIEEKVEYSEAVAAASMAKLYDAAECPAVWELFAKHHLDLIAARALAVSRVYDKWSCLACPRGSDLQNLSDDIAA